MRKLIIILVTLLLISLTINYIHLKNPSEVLVETDTIHQYDTITYTIENDIHHYHEVLDTIFLPIEISNNIDTNQIITNYFSTYVYDREFKDTNILVNITDSISQNEIHNEKFEYKILKPMTTTVINKNVANKDYNNIYVGATFPQYQNKEYFKVNLLYSHKKGYFNFGYRPFVGDRFEFTAGFRIFHW